jgi:diaminohydroxyphosphoribosylaminopyrimidine deaminase/5-amino-6-(5-phosphoribosylamino)uracil reductase
MSLDGRLSTAPGEERWITSAASRRHARELRAKVDAILIGAKTLRADNPRLTVRGAGAARQPWRIVVSRSGSLPREAHLFTDRFADRTIVSKASLDAVLREAGEKEITSVLIEGGGEILGQALDQRLVDKVQIYLGPVLIGGPIISFAGLGAGNTGAAPRLHRVRYERIGQDICVIGYPAYDAVSAE